MAGDLEGSGGTEPRRPSLLRRIAVVLTLTIALLVLILEVGSRLADRIVARRQSALDYDPKTHKSDVFDAIAFGTLDPAAKRLEDARTIPHPYLGYALKPSFHTAPDAVQQCSHNSLGFRGKETTWEKPPGVFRIVTSGGSSVYGQSESCDAAVWSQRLEDHLNEAGLGYRIEVINGGCSGYSIVENLINFATRLVDLHPDLLLHYEAINDMRCALYTRGGPVKHDNTQWRQPWPVDRTPPIEKLLEKSRTYLLWRFYCTDYRKLRPDLAYWAVVNYDPNGDPYDPAPVPDLGFETYRRNLVDLVTIARAHGTQVLLATQPLARYHLDSAPSAKKQLAGIDRIQDIEREVGRDLNVPVFELARVIEAEVQKELDQEIDRQRQADPSASTEELERRAKIRLHPDPLPKRPLEHVIFRHEVHPFDYGSELIARTLADHLLHSGLLPPKHE
jgi:lysophospholipase L1-like esterase